MQSEDSLEDFPKDFRTQGQVLKRLKLPTLLVLNL